MYHFNLQYPLLQIFRGLLLSIFILLTSLGGLAQADEGKKIVVLYASDGIGSGQVSRALNEVLVTSLPDSEVTLQTINRFESMVYRGGMRAMINSFRKHFPIVFDRFYQTFVRGGLQVPRIERLGTSVDEEKLMRFIEEKSPDVILSTSYMASEAIAHLRARGHLRNIRVGWVNVDTHNGYLPRIAKSMDMTFVPHSAVADRWRDFGLAENRISIAGVPVDSQLINRSFNIETFLSNSGLDPKAPLLFVSSSVAGRISTLAKSLQSLGNKIKTPLQVAVNCGDNITCRYYLLRLKRSLPRHISIRSVNASTNAEKIDYTKASTVYMTTGNGWDTSLGFYLLKPTLILDTFAGSESDNAKEIEKSGLALVARDDDQVASNMNTLLNDQKIKQQYFEKQLDLKNAHSFDQLVDFITNPKVNIPEHVVDLGIENGTTVRLAKEAILQIDADAPVDLEILLAYGKFSQNKIFNFKENLPFGDGNPFGHLALRVRDTVYTVNGLAQRGVEPNGIHTSSLEDYLYGVSRNYVHEEHTDTFGESYARDNISLRISGVPSATVEKILSELAVLEREWSEGRWTWSTKSFNCADVVDYVLLKAGFKTPEHFAVNGGFKTAVQNPGENKTRKITFPLDIFERYLNHFESDPTYRVELVSYTSVADTKNHYNRSTFPVSIYRPLKMLKQFFTGLPTSWESRVTKRLAVYPGDLNVHYENLSGSSVAVVEQKRKEDQLSLANRLTKLQEQEQDLERARAELEASGATAKQALQNLFKNMQSGQPLNLEELNAKDISLSAYHSKLDKLNRAQLDFFMEATIMQVQDILNELRHKMTQKKWNELLTNYKKVEKSYSDYEDNKRAYGRPTDHKRVMAAVDFFTQSSEFATKLDLMLQSNNFENGKDLQAKTSQWSKFSRFLTWVKAGFDFVKVLRFSIKNNNQSAPVFGRIADYIQKQAHQLGFYTEVIGQENIPLADPSKKEINIFVPTHRNPMLDIFAITQLEIQDAMVFIGLNEALSKMTQKYLGRVIAVGSGLNPIDQTMNQLAMGVTNNILIYPEGSTGAGIMETRPIRSHFTSGLLKRLKSEGYKINLIPVTLMNTGRFAAESPFNVVLRNRFLEKPERVNLQVKVGSALPAEVVDSILSGDNASSVNRLIRDLWLDTLETNDSLLHGQMRAQTSFQRIREIFKDVKSTRGLDCVSLLKTGSSIE